MTDPRPALAPAAAGLGGPTHGALRAAPAGEATVEQLAEGLGLTVSAIRQHLAALAELGLVASSEAPRSTGQRGRPTRCHHLTTAAEPLFPKAYGELTNQLRSRSPR